MTKWKYLTIEKSFFASDIELDELGEEGWELVSFFSFPKLGSFYYIFKRKYE